MNGLDILLLLVLGLSIASGLIKGIIREVFSLAGVLLGILVALVFSPGLSVFLERWIPYESAAYAAALLFLFVVTLLVMAILGHLLTKLFKFASLGLMNRLLGGLFGLVRGVLIGLVVVLGLTLILDADNQTLRESKVTPFLTWGARAMAPLLPEGPREVLLERLDDLPEVEIPTETI